MTDSWQQRKSYADVLGHRMAYVEEGEGAPIVLLHGNPTSSYLWRTIIPVLNGLGRVIAPDLIGMGDSDKLGPEDPARYTFVRHRDFLDALLEKLGVTGNVTLVVHDWGSGLGFDWARRHPGAIRGIAYMEAIITTLRSLDEWSDSSRELFRAFRSDQGEQLILEDNAFVEKMLPRGILRALDDEEMAEYRRPYREPGDSRLPTLTWPRQLPVGGEPADVTRIVEEYAQWLATTPGIPKFFVNAEPGVILRDRQRAVSRAWPDQTEITVPGRHFVQEDSGVEIGAAIAGWLSRLA
jgi:haloalkane dehalogenase